MITSRFLLFLLLTALSAATAAAQSASDKSTDSSQRSAARENAPLISSALEPRTPRIFNLQQDEAICYTLRTYRVARENPDSDSTRPAGYSTCQRATRFQLRTAVDSPKPEPR
jgi:hypothetical protein